MEPLGTEANQPTQPPPAAGVRMEWEALPERVRAAVEGWLGSRVVRAESQHSGFSPGVAARILTADGRRCFVKAAGPLPNPDTAGMHRREARISAALPAGVPVPRLRWSYDEGEGGWVALVFDEVIGVQPAQPWRMDELERVLGAAEDLANLLTPSPLPVSEAGTVREALARQICGWARLRDEQPSRLGGLDAWSARNLERLIALEAEAPQAADGETLLQFDLRADNLLLSEDRVWVLDWPLACVGAAWVDVLFFAPSVTMQGGPLPEQVLARYPALREADPERVNAALASVAGFFTHRSLQPPPPGLPTLRPFQAAQGLVARAWLARRLGGSA